MHISIREIFGKSWELTKKHFGFLALLFLVTAVVQGSISGMNGGGEFLLNLLLGTCILIAWTRVSLDVTSGKEPSIDSIGVEFKNYLVYLAASFVFQLALVIGFILLIIPGIYIAVTYNWFAYLIAEKHYGVMESLKQSAVLADGARWQIMKFFLAILGLNILGLLALVVGLFVTVPMSMIAGALVYRSLALRTTAKAATPAIETASVPTPAV